MPTKTQPQTGCTAGLPISAARVQHHIAAKDKHHYLHQAPQACWLVKSAQPEHCCRPLLTLPCPHPHSQQLAVEPICAHQHCTCEQPHCQGLRCGSSQTIMRHSSLNGAHLTVLAQRHCDGRPERRLPTIPCPFHTVVCKYPARWLSYLWRVAEHECLHFHAWDARHTG